MAKIDLGAVARAAATAGPALLHPRDIFGALPNRAAEYQYLRGPQDQVLDQWFSRRDESDLVIKMNAGGGKTGVGLLIGQSRGGACTAHQLTV